MCIFATAAVPGLCADLMAWRVQHFCNETDCYHVWDAMSLHLTGLRKLQVLKEQPCLWSPQWTGPGILEKMLKTKGLCILAVKVGILTPSKGKSFHYKHSVAGGHRCS